jgi:hypothetical protein
MAEPNSTSYQIGRIRKAIVAGAAAGAAAVWALVAPPFTGGTEVTGILADGKIDAQEVGTVLGTFFTVGVPAGYLAWLTPNKAERHASPDVATMAAEREVANLALPATEDALAYSDPTLGAPTDAELPAPGASAAGLPSTDDERRGRHEA